MAIQPGDRVLVNLAPFIGSAACSPQRIACRVTALCGEQVEVETDYPYRQLRIRVSLEWVEPAEADCAV